VCEFAFNKMKIEYVLLLSKRYDSSVASIFDNVKPELESLHSYISIAHKQGWKMWEALAHLFFGTC